MLPTEIVLISCLLFLCLENFQHNSLIAVQHLQSGLNILQDWRQTQRRSPKPQASESESIIEEYLAPVFARMDLHVDTLIEDYSRRTRIRSQNISHGDGVPLPPAKFFSMRQIRDCVELELRYHLRLLGLDTSSTSRRMLDDEKLTELWNRITEIFEKLDAMVSAMAFRNTDILRAVAYLKIIYYTDKIMLQTSSYHNEKALDTHTEDFRQILFWCQDYVRCGTQDVSPIKFSFQLDLGIVHICFGVASRCRDPFVRRQAIRQLRASRRREGLWDSHMAANIAERIVAIEEQGLGEVRTSHDVPESRRIQILRVKYDANGSAHVSRSDGGDGQGRNDGSACMALEWIRYPYVEGAIPKEEEWVLVSPPDSRLHAGLDPHPKPTFGTGVYRHTWSESRGGPPIYGVAHIKAMLSATGSADGP